MNTRPLPAHGTWQRYANKRSPCREACCRAPWLAYQDRRNRQIAYGRHAVDPVVTASHARVHLLELNREGYGNAKTLPTLTGVSAAVLHRVAIGQAKRIRRSTADAILAVTLDTVRASIDELPDSAFIEPAGARRRLQALIANGWTMERLALELGCSSRNVQRILADGQRVEARTHRRIAQTYDRLWNVSPTFTTVNEKAQSTRAKQYAAERGWVPPLAWDEDTIDDPTCEPENVMRPAVEHKIRRTVDTVEDVAWILQHDQGATTAQVCERLGITKDALTMALTRRADALERQALDEILGDHLGPLTHDDAEQVAAARKPVRDLAVQLTDNNEAAGAIIGRRNEAA